MINEKLKKIDIFKNLDEDKIANIAEISSVKHFNKDNILFYEGEEPTHFYFLIEGYVKLYKSDLKGNEIVLHYFTNSMMIAEVASLENMNFPATAIAMKDEVEILLLEKEKFLEMLKTDAYFSFHVVKSLTQKVKNLEVVINRNLVYDAMTKVCSFIKENPNLMDHTKSKEVANILNMAPETLSRIFSKLRKLDILDKQNRLIHEVKLDMLLDN